MSRSVENQRSRLVAALTLLSLCQDFFLFWANLFAGLANLTNGVCSFFKALSQSAINFSNTFLRAYRATDAKYEALTGDSFSSETAGADEDDE